jgi:hypothetical protein
MVQTGFAQLVTMTVDVRQEAWFSGPLQTDWLDE